MGNEGQIEVRPATAERFADVATVLGPRKPTSNVCWCLSHRVDSRTNRELAGPARGDVMRELCGRDVSPGVLAYDGDEVVGWTAVAPRAELPLSRSGKYPLLDDRPAWSIFCIRVRPGFRRRGIAHHLLEGAVAYAASRGAPVVEGYPADNGDARMDLTMAFVGTRKLFEDADFTYAAPTDAVAGGFPRVVMRRELG